MCKVTIYSMKSLHCCCYCSSASIANYIWYSRFYALVVWLDFWPFMLDNGELGVSRNKDLYHHEKWLLESKVMIWTRIGKNQINVLKVECRKTDVFCWCCLYCFVIARTVKQVLWITLCCSSVPLGRQLINPPGSRVVPDHCSMLSFCRNLRRQENYLLE